MSKKKKTQVPETGNESERELPPGVKLPFPKQ